MKTCKKILAGVLVFAMMLSMCAFVYAEEVAETPATNVPLIGYSFDTAEITDSVTINNLAYETLVVGYELAASSYKFGSNGITDSAVAAKAEGDNYISSKCSQIGINFRQSYDALKVLDAEGNYPVLSLSYDIMIPADDEYRENLRFGSFGLGTSKASSYSRLVVVSPKIQDGKVWAGADGVTPTFSKEIDYTYGEWLTFNVRTWVDTATKKLVVGVYAGGELIYYGLSDANAAGIAGSDFRFNYANSPDGVTKVEDKSGTWKNGILQGDGVAATITSATCYDNFNVGLYSEASKVSDAELDAALAAQREATSYARILEYSGDAIASTAGTKKEVVFNNTAVAGGSMVLSNSSADDTTRKFEVVDSSYTNITTSQYTYLLTNFRSSVFDWVQKDDGDTTTFVCATSFNLQDYSAGITGSNGFLVDQISAAIPDPTNPGATIAARNGNNLSVSYTIAKDTGKLSFNDSFSTDKAGSRKSGALRSEERTVPVGEWIDLKVIYEVTHGEEQYDIKIYGVYNDDVIFVDEVALYYADHNKDGINDDLGIAATLVRIGTSGKEHATTVTGFDNFYIDKYNNFDWAEAGINRDAWAYRDVDISKLESGNYKVYAKYGEDGFTNGILVMAICNANGYVDKIITSTDIANGAFSYEIPAAEVKPGNIIKGFVFDTITSAKPQMPSGKYIVE